MSVLLGEFREDVALFEHHGFVVGVAEDATGHLLAAVLGVQHLVADFDVDGLALAVVVESAGANGEYVAELPLLAGGIGDNEAAGAHLILLDLLDDDAIAQWDDLRRALAGVLAFRCCGHCGLPPTDPVTRLALAPGEC